VKYEKLPNYCYSCGIIGHSSLECPNPADRDEKGLLPYGRDLRAVDENKYKKGLENRQSNNSSGRSTSSRGHGSGERHQGQQSSDNQAKTGRSATVMDQEKEGFEEETLSLLKRQSQKEEEIVENGTKTGSKDLVLSPIKGHGTKRKQARNDCYVSNGSEQILRAESSNDAMALIVRNTSMHFNPGREMMDKEIVLDEGDDEMVKKMKKTSDTHTRSAEAAWQPRREP